VKNPFRFGCRWSWVRILPGRPYFAPGQGPVMPVNVAIRWWHPLAWVFVVNHAFKHVRIRIERTA
jgi:hypothetical protein